MIGVMAFDLRQILRRGDLRGLSPLEVSGRILLRIVEAAGATEIDRAAEESPFDVFAVNLFAGHRTGRDAVAFAEEFAFDGLGRRSLSLALSLLVMLVV